METVPQYPNALVRPNSWSGYTAYMDKIGILLAQPITSDQGLLFLMCFGLTVDASSLCPHGYCAGKRERSSFMHAVFPQINFLLLVQVWLKARF